MNIVFTCGGTGGHIYPAIAVARMFRERQPDCKILFIGAEDGMENKIVPREGFRDARQPQARKVFKLGPLGLADPAEGVFVNKEIDISLCRFSTLRWQAPTHLPS